MTVNAKDADFVSHAVPVLKWFIYPFFKRPHNELTSIPIHVTVESSDTVTLPMKLVERLVSEIDECHCAGVKNRLSTRLNIGCMVFSLSIDEIQPSSVHVSLRRRPVYLPVVYETQGALPWQNL